MSENHDPRQTIFAFDFYNSSISPGEYLFRLLFPEKSVRNKMVKEVNKPFRSYSKYDHTDKSTDIGVEDGFEKRHFKEIHRYRKCGGKFPGT